VKDATISLVTRPPLLATAFCCAALLVTALPLGAASGFDLMQQRWETLAGYSVTIESHEVMGDQSDDHEFHYSFHKPTHAQLDIVRGTRSGGTILWEGGDGVVAYKRPFTILREHANAWDVNLTSLRGNGILSSNMGDLIDCLGAHRGALREKPGPVLDGVATDEISLAYAGFTCPDDSTTDRGAVTLDVVDVASATGLVLLRTRYQGSAVVERWELKDYKIDAPSIGPG